MYLVNLYCKTLRLAATLMLCAMGYATQAAELTVSAAASLSNAFKDIAPAFEAQYPGTRVLLNFAASDTLLAQIAQGAPVDVFASADQDTMDKAQAQQLIIPGSRVHFTSNTLVAISPSAPRPSSTAATPPLTRLTDLTRPEVQRIALGKPEGVPAGRYAKQALQAAQLWPQIEAKAIYASNVRQALDYVARGEVDVGLVYATDAVAQKDKVQVLFGVPTPTPIHYPIAIVRTSTQAPAAKGFIAFVNSAAGQAILARHGFQKP